MPRTVFVSQSGGLARFSNQPNMSDRSARVAAAVARRDAAVMARRPVAARSAVVIPAGMFRRTNRGKTEVKTVDTTYTGNFDNNSAVANCLFLLNTIPQDASPTGRIGKKVMLKAIQLRGRVIAASATTAENCCAILIYVRNPNQAATLPAVTEILVTQSSGALSNRDNASKFKILRRWDFPVTGNITTPGTGKELYDFEAYVPLKGLASLWTNAGTAGTIGQFVEGALLLLTVGFAANGATTTPQLIGNSRVYFTDV